MTPEGRVKKKVKALLSTYGAYQDWPVPAGYGKPTLDCIGCHKGRYFAIETKAPGKHLTPRQEDTKANMEAAQGKVFVVVGSEENNPDTWTGFMELEEWLKSK